MGAILEGLEGVIALFRLNPLHVADGCHTLGLLVLLGLLGLNPLHVADGCHTHPLAGSCQGTLVRSTFHGHPNLTKTAFRTNPEYEPAKIC